MLSVLLCLAGQGSVEAPVVPFEFRAAWVATVDNIDWPSKKTLTTAQQKAELIRIFDKARALNLNAIIFQVRPSADALYPSKLEPWSEFLTGKQGRAPNPSYDPLKFAVEEAHKRGLELHCWFNPYRALHPAQTGPVAANHISKTHPGIVKKYGKFLWMDPGEAAIQKRSLDVILDVVKRYDIDGVHIDDYFYPYPDKVGGQNVDFPDGASWKRYRGRLSRGDWRRKNVDDFIQRLYKGIKKEKRWVKFGISPFGIYRPGVPSTIKAGIDQYAELYADALKWFREGWCDYFTPQLYWPITQTPQAYPTLLKWWASENVAGRHFWPGNYTSRTMPTEGNWQAIEIVDQVYMTQTLLRAKAGNVHFSMKPLLLNSNGVADALLKGPYKTPAFVPPSPWLASSFPAPVTVVENRDEGSGWNVGWESGARRFYVCIGVPDGDGVAWTRWYETSEKSLKYGDGIFYAAVAAVDRAGNVGPVVVVKRG